MLLHWDSWQNPGREFILLWWCSLPASAAFIFPQSSAWVRSSNYCNKSGSPVSASFLSLYIHCQVHLHQHRGEKKRPHTDCRKKWGEQMALAQIMKSCSMKCKNNAQTEWLMTEHGPVSKMCFLHTEFSFIPFCIILLSKGSWRSAVSRVGICKADIK